MARQFQEDKFRLWELRAVEENNSKIKIRPGPNQQTVVRLTNRYVIGHDLMETWRQHLRNQPNQNNINNVVVELAGDCSFDPDEARDDPDNHLNAFLRSLGGDLKGMVVECDTVISQSFFQCLRSLPSLKFFTIGWQCKEHQATIEAYLQNPNPSIQGLTLHQPRAETFSAFSRCLPAHPGLVSIYWNNRPGVLPQLVNALHNSDSRNTLQNLSVPLNSTGGGVNRPISTLVTLLQGFPSLKVLNVGGSNFFPSNLFEVDEGIHSFLSVVAALKNHKTLQDLDMWVSTDAPEIVKMNLKDAFHQNTSIMHLHLGGNLEDLEPAFVNAVTRRNRHITCVNLQVQHHREISNHRFLDIGYTLARDEDGLSALFLLLKHRPDKVAVLRSNGVMTTCSARSSHADGRSATKLVKHTLFEKDRGNHSMDSAKKQCKAFTEWLNYMLGPNKEQEEESRESKQEGFHSGVVQQKLAPARLRSRLAWKVPCTQKQIDKIDFSINNLAVDLRDGVRLTRLVEVLAPAPAKSLLQKLRLPAVSRGQKFHNVEFVLQTLREQGVAIGPDVKSHHIVDGHREIVLKLIWAIICRFCPSHLISEERIREEILKLRKAHCRDQHSSVLTMMDTNSHQDNEESRFQILLLEWCNAVCAQFGVAVSNLSLDFADGVVPCLLLHFYMPNLLHLSEIWCTSKTMGFMKASAGNIEILHHNEQKNCELANRKLLTMGGIEQMVPVSDSSNLPDPKAMLLCLMFMCSQILDCSNEIQACITIQRAARKRQRIKSIKCKMIAANFIMDIWKLQKDSYYQNQKKKYKEAVMGKIETFFLKRRHRVTDKKERALQWEDFKHKISKLQLLVRRSIAQKKFRALVDRHEACTALQCWWRTAQALNMVQTLRVDHDAARTIQRAYRWSQEVDRSKNFASMIIQKHWRGFCCRVNCKIELLDITDVQSCVRRFIALRRYNHIMAAVPKIQSLSRGFLLRRKLEHERMERDQRHAAAWMIQTAAQQYIIRCRAARSIQATWKCYSVQMDYLKLLLGVLGIQSAFRRKVEMKVYTQRFDAVLKLQRFGRTCLQKIEAYQHHAAAWMIQTAAQRYIIRFRAARSIQATWKFYSVQMDYLKLLLGVLGIQSAFRRKVAMKVYTQRFDAVFWKDLLAKDRGLRCLRGCAVHLNLEYAELI